MQSPTRTNPSRALFPMIMAGGIGSRLWPLSRRATPKQFLPLTTEESAAADDRAPRSCRASLLELTLARMARILPDRPLGVLSGQENHFQLSQLLAEFGKSPARQCQLLIEPSPRGTAATAIVAAHCAHRQDPEALVALVPSDHHISGEKQLADALVAAAAAAELGLVCTLGIRPDGPRSEYGYIKTSGEELAPGVFRALGFHEKPDPATAASYFRQNGECKTPLYLWNSGIFVYGAASFLEEFRALEPELVDTVCRALDEAEQRDDGSRLLKSECFNRARIDTLDYAFMEKAARVAVVPADIDWSDVGSWDALWQLAGHDRDGNVLKGDVRALDTRDSYVSSTSRLVATLGLEDMVVVETEDAVLVTPRARSSEIGDVVKSLTAEGRGETQTHALVERPWGSYRVLAEGPGYKVKRIQVDQGSCLSLQYHNHRSEHWVVVCGVASVTIDGSELELAVNQSVYVPLRAHHRLANHTEEIIEIIEVQIGDYLGEDDIIRLEDQYGRT